MSVYTLNPFVKEHSKHINLPSFLASLGNIEGSYSIDFDFVGNLDDEEVLEEDTEKQTRTSIYEGLFMFFSAIEHCKDITPIKDYSIDVTEALQDVYDLLNIIMHTHYITLDLKRYEDDITNFGLSEKEFNDAGTLAMIQMYHFLELPIVDRFWFVGKPFHKSDLPMYLRLSHDTQRCIKKLRKGVNQVFRALSIQHLQMHGLDFNEDYLTEKNFDKSLTYSHPIAEKIISGELVTINDVTDYYNKSISTKPTLKKSNVIALK
ncbi:hypothetical protein ACRZ5S_19670 [Vibrio scophthalmi]|uniref:hypothetical protein n=1 Tax=Vibrio scophthalmi TaxID=45658 RepID=UPI003EBB86C5